MSKRKQKIYLQFFTISRKLVCSVYIIIKATQQLTIVICLLRPWSSTHFNCNQHGYLGFHNNAKYFFAYKHKKILRLSLFITYVNTKYLRSIKHFNWDLTVLNMDNVGKKADDQSLNRHKNVPNCLGQIVTGIQIIIA